MKTRVPGKKPREGAILLRGSCDPAPDDTTSEPHARKCHAGRTRYSANEWYALRTTRVEPWNTLYPTPDLVQGMGIFYTFPTKKGGKYHV